MVSGGQVGGRSSVQVAGRVPAGAPRAPGVSWGAIDLVAFLALYLGVSIPVIAWTTGITPAAAPPPIGGAFVSSIYAASHLAAVGLIVVIVRVRGGRVAELGWRRAPATWVLAAAPLASAASVLSAVLAVASRFVLPGAHTAQCDATRSSFGGQVALGLVLMCVVGPFVEETLFRGFLFGWLRTRVPLPAAVLISAVLFAPGHFHPDLFLPTFALGVLLTVVYQRSGSLWPGMLVHGIFNAAAVLAMLHGAC
jgi:CAAX protease family protein